MKKQSFLTGAIILMIANAISKILGAVLKIPLSYILNEDGMAVYSVAFEIYIMFLSFIISGLPFAISKLTAEANSRGEHCRERKIVSVSTYFLAVIGAAGSIILYIAAPFFALAMKEEKAIYAIRMISPSIFFVALGTGYKSYFQGVSRMTAPAVSQVVESFVKLAAGYALAVFFVGCGAEKTAGGAIVGVTAGEIIATAILALSYIFGRKEKGMEGKDERRSDIFRDIMLLALPLLCASVISNALGIADTTLTRTRLLDSGLTSDDARFLYGAYTGYALTVFHLPVGILATLGVSILPVIAGAYATGNTKKAEKATDAGMKIATALSVPCAVIMFTMSREILMTLFRNDTSALMLKTVAPCAVMMCAAQMNAAILQSAGKIMTPFYNSLAGMAVKLVLGYVLIGNPRLNIYGSAISATAAYTVIMILNYISTKKKLGLNLSILSIIIKPILCGVVMYAVMRLLSGAVSYMCGGFIYLALMCAAGCAAYALSLILTGTFDFNEIKQLLEKNVRQ